MSILRSSQLGEETLEGHKVTRVCMAHNSTYAVGFILFRGSIPSFLYFYTNSKGELEGRVALPGGTLTELYIPIQV